MIEYVNIQLVEIRLALPIIKFIEVHTGEHSRFVPYLIVIVLSSRYVSSDEGYFVESTAMKNWTIWYAVARKN